MIDLTRLSDQKFTLNADYILEIEATPDTIITLTSGQKVLVKETVEAVKAAVIKYKRTIMGNLGTPTGE